MNENNPHEPPQESHWKMQPNQPLALQPARRDISVLVYDAVNLESILMMLPEVQTILDAIAVGGHRITDQDMALNQTCKHACQVCWQIIPGQGLFEHT
ncbi:hypothetical protein DFQ45_101376 [Thiopseudomonas denitrificans]|uniref:Uncharacterized protein n=1 Tax=Thiopseudomonas denitrificans TaxID=1501432 RepID=A0A4R6U2N2_9GAMM|nr:hypothetical protein DFQ45_101376 [Thiopseudomonas denitrificans]